MEYRSSIELTTTAGNVVMFIGFIVLLTGLFVTMSTLVGLFMIFAGIITMIQGANMKPVVAKPIPGTIKDTTKTFTLEPRKDTKGPLSNVKSKGAV